LHKKKDERSNTVRRVVVREAGQDRRRFLGEEDRVGCMEGKRGEHSPWRMVDKGLAYMALAVGKGLAVGKEAVKAKES